MYVLQHSAVVAYYARLLYTVLLDGTGGTWFRPEVGAPRIICVLMDVKCGSMAEWLGARLAINRLRVRILAAALVSATPGKLFTCMCLCYQAV